MKSLFITLLFILSSWTQVFAQDSFIDSLNNALKKEQEDTNKVNTLNILSTQLRLVGKYNASLISAKTAQNIGEKIGYKKGIATALLNSGHVNDEEGNYPQALTCYFKALDIAKELGNKRSIASNLGSIGTIYDEEGNYTSAMDYYNQALAIYQKLGDKNCISIVSSNIGIVYEEQKNYSKAIEYYQKAIEFDEAMGNKNSIAHDMGNMGSIYSEIGLITESLEYSFKALAINRELKNKRGMSIDLANIGNSYLLQKKFMLAKAYLDSALNLSTEIRQMFVTRNVYITLTSLDSAMGNYQKAFEDNKKVLVYRDSLVNQESVKKITQLELRFEYQKKEDSINSAQEKANIIRAAEISRKNLITYGTIIIEILTGILAILFINRQQIRRKRDKLLFEKEKQHMEGELKNAQIMLDEYLKSMLEKNQLLEQFKTDVENLTNLKAKVIDENRIETLENLNKATILTDEDWDKFKKLFEEAYRGFFVRLKEKLPDLTQAEIRLVCLTKLKLETKQMAAVLGVSADTIKKTRHRLRKKLGLSEEDSLDDISLSI